MAQSLASGLPPTQLSPSAAPSAQVEDPVGAYISGSAANVSVNAGVGDQDVTELARRATVAPSPRLRVGPQTAVHGRGLNKAEPRRLSARGVLTAQTLAIRSAGSAPSAPKRDRLIQKRDRLLPMTEVAKRQLKLSGKDQKGLTGGARYSRGFQDSTRGTGLVSPPDPGTAGPFAGFSPDISLGLPDFTSRQFLSPSLHLGGRAPNARRARQAAINTARTPAGGPQGSALSDSLGGDLGASTLSNDSGLSETNSDLSTGIDTSVPTSIDPQ